MITPSCQRVLVFWIFKILLKYYLLLTSYEKSGLKITFNYFDWALHEFPFIFNLSLYKVSFALTINISLISWDFLVWYPAQEFWIKNWNIANIENAI